MPRSPRCRANPIRQQRSSGPPAVAGADSHADDSRIEMMQAGVPTGRQTTKALALPGEKLLAAAILAKQTVYLAVKIQNVALVNAKGILQSRELRLIETCAHVLVAQDF